VITGPNDAEDVPVGAIQPSDGNSSRKYSTGSDGKLTVDDPIEQIAMPAQKHRPVRSRFSARVERRRLHFLERLAPPTGNQTPAHRYEPLLFERGDNVRVGHMFVAS
jgi:hypothetical protein